MGTVETRSPKAPSGCSSPLPENDNNELREALCALKDGALESGVGDVVEVVKSRVFETNVSVRSDFVGREVEDECEGLADSEMNGVSSLLKMRGSGGRGGRFSYGVENGSFGVGIEGERKDLKKSEDEDNKYGKMVTIDVPIVETSDNKDLEMDDFGGDGYEFSVGDFVWGKIKNHPWWPGRIYDHSDASDFALKLRQKNRLLVAYFGDGTFAWCHPSQLKPFEENFEDMVMQSSSRVFVNAVQEAVNEVGRLLDLKLSYSYSAKQTKSEFALPVATNSGIKEGHLVPENGIEKLLNVLIDPAELLSRVKQIAEVVSITSILELEVLKSRLSAVCLSRGGYKLPSYEEPEPIPGLEDGSTDETSDVANSKGVVEAPVHGPFEEEYTLPASPKSGEPSNSQGISGNTSNHRRKQKSIAEIMGEDRDVSNKNKEEDATELVMVRRRKRKGSEDAMPSKPVQKRKGFTSTENDGKENSDQITLSQLKEKKEAFGNENASSGSKTDEGDVKEQYEKGYLSRERKKSKYLSPPFTTPPTRGQRKGEIETESLKVSSKAQPSEPITRAENFSNKLVIQLDLPGSSNYQTPDGEENNVINPLKVQASSGEVLSKIRHAAINSQIPRDDNSLEKLMDFISVYRSSLYSHGSSYEVYDKHHPGRKRKKPESDVEMLRKDQNQTNHMSPNNGSEPRKRRRKETTTLGKPEEQSGKSKSGKKRTDEKSPAAATLLVSFGPGSTVPSKHDLVTVYSKFGALNESETGFSDNYTAHVSFLKASDAENALNHSQNMSPFGSLEVSFGLQYLSARSESGEHVKKSKSKSASSAKSPGSPLTGCEASKLKYIKLKLLGMTSILEALDGKSPDMKTKLESEMKQLLEDVDKMVESSSS
ncbi:hypothetical protein Lal_00041094 [Lupinus albus]|uniref:Putative non-specific serine/threonine protein kinase n=1 Tax=Lupinus albus TaxID=3870 RepID=A0A6A4P4V2_LUPAL|nr:putative non-specific serine/threonine protein kinase [Lupinus albus]KAF1863107.1 hypothetical protein Lal_00041094 [Lupinus albus]